MHCPFATVSLPARTLFHHPSWPVTPAPGPALFCGTLCLPGFMLSDLALVAVHNTISFSAHIPLQMVTTTLPPFLAVGFNLPKPKTSMVRQLTYMYIYMRVSILHLGI